MALDHRVDGHCAATLHGPREHAVAHGFNRLPIHIDYADRLVVVKRKLDVFGCFVVAGQRTVEDRVCPVHVSAEQVLGAGLASPTTARHEEHQAAIRGFGHALLKRALRERAGGLVHLGCQTAVGAVLGRQLARLVGVQQLAALGVGQGAVLLHRAVKV